MNFRILILLSITATIFTQSTPSFKGQNCATTYSSTDTQNEGCKTCRTGYYKKQVSRRILTTQRMRFLQTAAKKKFTCYKCPTGCNTCELFEGQLTCPSCPNNDYFPVYSLIKGVNKITSCGKCMPGCISCSQSDKCIMSTGCKHGYWKDTTNSLCPACKKGCSECTSATACTACSNAYFLKSNDCLPCSNGCYKCTDQSTCNDCYGSYDLKNGICVSKPFYRQVWFWMIVILLLLIAACVACAVINKMKDQAFQAQNSMISNEHHY